MPRSLLLAMALALSLQGCGYNDLQRGDEQIKAAWSEVMNQYQRRADLVPNLVATVKGFAEQEKEIFTRVTEARSRVGQMQATPELVENPEAFAKFQAAQRELGGALQRLIVVAENYPQLKSDAQFLRLEDELAGTENRLAVERKRYNDKVRDYDTARRQFPANLTAKMFGFKEYPYFQAPPDAKPVPKVNFSK